MKKKETPKKPAMPEKKPAPVKRPRPSKKPEPTPTTVVVTPKQKKFSTAISDEDHARLVRIQKKTGLTQAKLLHEFIELYGKTHRIK